ncbi:MAG: hypothetical protein IKC37_01005 [Clostridia bacterium]|nr:hypothetical protein [Clostridia bacterium]
MQKEEWIAFLQENKQTDGFLSALPLGWDAEGKAVHSHRKNRQDRFCHTCVTGANRTSFLVDTVAALATAYGAQGASFLVLSPKTEYAKLLTLKAVDITVPYFRTKEDYTTLMALAKEQVEMRKKNPRLPKYFVVVDGLEGCSFLPKDNACTFLRGLVDELSGGAEVLSGVDFSGSIFLGFEGAFVGVGNSLVSTDEKGKADVTYVGDDCLLDCPQSISYALCFGGN